MSYTARETSYNVTAVGDEVGCAIEPSAESFVLAAGEPGMTWRALISLAHLEKYQH
jgi:hypothetical protein